MHEVLKLLNELLPAIDRDLNVPLNSNKEDFLVNEPNFLQKFGRDLVPILIEVSSLYEILELLLYPPFDSVTITIGVHYGAGG